MSITIRNTRIEDIGRIRDLQIRTYPAIAAWSPAQFEQHICTFPQGQFVALFDDRIVGSASSLIVLWDDYGLEHHWREVTGDGSFKTHTPSGKTLYGAEVFVDPSIRRQGIGRSMYAARRMLCRKLKLKRIIAAGRLPGYHRYAKDMSAESYAMRVIWGDIEDPVLRFQLREGFQFCGVIPGYLPDDVESCGYAALIVWLNPEHRDSSRRRQGRGPALPGSVRIG